MIIDQLYKSDDFVTQRGYNLINHTNFINTITEEEMDAMDASTRLRFEITKEYLNNLGEKIIKELMKTQYKK